MKTKRTYDQEYKEGENEITYDTNEINIKLMTYNSRRMGSKLSICKERFVW